MARAHYHNELLHAKEFTVLAKNKDGSVELGNGSTVSVSCVPVSDLPKVGHAVLVPEISKLEIQPEYIASVPEPDQTETVIKPKRK
jgi:hypothetical protein